jgi:hypothetical protein
MGNNQKFKSKIGKHSLVTNEYVVDQNEIKLVFTGTVRKVNFQ